MPKPPPLPALPAAPPPPPVLGQAPAQTKPTRKSQQATFLGQQDIPSASNRSDKTLLGQ